MTRRALITGGYGYVGGRVARELALRDWDITLGTRRAQRARPDWLPQAVTIQFDWNSSEQLVAACAGQDAVIHLAAMNEKECSADRLGALAFNGGASLRLLEAAEKSGVKRFVYVSTAHVYGAPLAGEIDEGHVTRPAQPYAITHKVAEDFVLAAHDARRIEGVVLRLSNGFGAPVHADIDCWVLLVNDLCRQVVTNGTLVLRSAGLQRRDFITLADAARAIAHVLELPEIKLADGLFNLGGDAPMRIIDMANLILERCAASLGYRPRLQVGERGPGEQAAGLCYSSEKLQRTGFSLLREHAKEIDATLRFCARLFGKTAQ